MNELHFKRATFRGKHALKVNVALPFKTIQKTTLNLTNQRVLSTVKTITNYTMLTYP